MTGRGFITSKFSSTPLNHVTSGFRRDVHVLSDLLNCSVSSTDIWRTGLLLHAGTTGNRPVAPNLLARQRRRPKAVTVVWPLATGFPPRNFGFSSRPVRVIFVVDKVALGQVPSVSTCQYTNATYS
jgi:hypothetical protein